VGPSPMAAADDGTAAEMTQCGKRTDCHPTTSARSHLSDGVFLGVSQVSRNPKTLEFSTFSRLFRFQRSSESRRGTIKPEIAQDGHRSDELLINPPERFRIISANKCMCCAWNCDHSPSIK
jgi:hypothetical protein